MNVYVFLDFSPGLRVCALSYLFPASSLNSRAQNSRRNRAGPVVAALLLLVIAVGMGERRSKDLLVFEQNSSLLPREVTGLRVMHGNE